MSSQSTSRLQSGLDRPRLRWQTVFRMALWLGTLSAVVMISIDQSRSGSDPTVYPNKPITVIVPFTAGGESDAFARMIQHAAAENDLLGQELVIQNVGGAGATIGSGRARKADADGYTMMILHEALITAQSSGKVPYGPESFEPIAATGKTRIIIAVRDDSPYDSLSQIMEAAKDRPNQLVFAANLGAPVHYAGLILERQLPGSHFRYTQTGGGAKRFEAVKGGHADVSAFSLGEYIAYKAGGLKAIAISAEQRDPRVADIPTAREQGFDFVHANMHFWWFPKGTDQAKIDRIAQLLRECMQTDIVRKQLAHRLSEPLIKTGEPMKLELADRISKIQSVDSASPDVLPNTSMWVLLATLASLAGMVLSSLRQKKTADQGTQTDETRPQGYWKRAGLALLVTVIYVFALEYFPIDYRWLTMLFMFCFGLTIAGRSLLKLRGFKIPVYADVVILVPLIIFAVFQSVFHIELP
ncbi:MAG: tripartite tricarboxylate transporter substrate binding protein [Planctomycetota bacterium]|nr:tripartite tricarboxylate transporter substrate binding protein [Planctomycetota bacterium]